MVRGLLVPSLILLTACSGFKKRNLDKPVEDEAIREASKSHIEENEVSSEDVEKNLERPYQSAYGEIRLDENEYVDVWIKYFKGRGRPYMEQYLARSTRYLPMMKNVMRENGLPEDLVYIALIESGFSPRAHSRANAVGYWQFIRSTGKRFGMQVDTFTDERRDPVLSTRAAAEYFKALHNLLGDWHLAMASYNVGEGRVKRAVTKYRTKDFWALLKKRRALPAETRNYVPKFIAATLIAKNPAKYGFNDIEYQDPLSYDTVALQSPISLTKLANNINVSVEELQLLNPKFRTDFVPIALGNETVVRIPVGRASDALAALSMSVTQQPKVLQAEYYYYRVRRGDNLSTIARKHRTTVSQLRRLNDISNRTLLRVGRSLKVPDNGGDGIKFVTDDEEAREPASRRRGAVAAVEKREATYHIVRRGDNLSTIARRYNISMEELLKLNKISNRSVIRKGQKLRVRPEAPPPTSASFKRRQSLALASFKSNSMKSGKAKKVSKELPRTSRVAAAQSKAAVRRHTVKRGETLYEVSKKYGLSLSELAKANKVRINYRVMAGEKLLIPD
jgi:membrane-bound lytic murein transglycosylase D